jgi:hypothetical protein
MFFNSDGSVTRMKLDLEENTVFGSDENIEIGKRRQK